MEFFERLSFSTGLDIDMMDGVTSPIGHYPQTVQMLIRVARLSAAACFLGCSGLAVCALKEVHQPSNTNSNSGRLNETEKFSFTVLLGSSVFFAVIVFPHIFHLVLVLLAGSTGILLSMASISAYGAFYNQ